MSWFSIRNLGRSAALVTALIALFSSYTATAQMPEANFAAPFEIDDEMRQALLDAVESSESFVDKYDAEVWLLSKSSILEQFMDDPQARLELLKLIHSEASRAGLNPDIVLAVIEVESHFERFAISSAGAQGLMQVMPFWKNEIGREDDNLTDIPTNLRYGCTILRHYLEREDGNMRFALARYNGSVGKNWYPELVLNAWDRWK